MDKMLSMYVFFFDFMLAIGRQGIICLYVCVC